MCRIKHEKRSCLLKKQLLVYLLKIVLFVGVHDSSLSHINISLIFNSLISQCNPGVSEYLFNIDLIEFSTLRRRLVPLQYIINNQKLTLLL